MCMHKHCFACMISFTSCLACLPCPKGAMPPSLFIGWGSDICMLYSSNYALSIAGGGQRVCECSCLWVHICVSLSAQV